MSAAKKRKVEDECRAFNDEWTARYCFANVGSKAVCLLCRECVSVFKEYNLKRHHQTKHSDFGHNFTCGQIVCKLSSFIFIIIMIGQIGNNKLLWK